MRRIEDYRSIVGDDAVYQIYRKARHLYASHVLNINSTYIGGGVAEMLSSQAPLMNDVGIQAGWRILHGNPNFYEVTKQFHNALQGDPIDFTEDKKRLYFEANGDFASYTHLLHDLIVIHDPQPLALIDFYRKDQPWIWRCHIDLTHPNAEVWDFLKRFIIRYDLVIISDEAYRRPDLAVEQRVIHPGIDPLSIKNKELPDDVMEAYLARHGLDDGKPFIAQVSRFDKWKDPAGVVEVFKRVREKIDCRLVLIGGMATDDPEGWDIYRAIEQDNRDLIEQRRLVLITIEDNLLVNTVQRKAAAIIQRSTREGFGLTVTEAMWKRTPVVASRIGGIPLQITDSENGYLLDPHDLQGFADRIIFLIQNPKARDEIGKKARESVRKNFLMNRVLADWLDLYNYILS